MDNNQNQIDLLFHGVKRISINELASESRLSVGRCNKFVIILFYQEVKKMQSPSPSFSKVKRSDGWREFRWKKNSLHSSSSLKAAKISLTYR